MSEKSLNQLKPKEKGKVIKVSGSNGIRRRILDMGITKGADVEMERVAPLGDPVEVKVKGYHLSLRKDEAANIFILVEEKMNAISLTMAPPDKEMVLVSVMGGRGLRARLTDMGLTEGVKLKVLQSDRRGPCIVLVGNTRLVLGCGISQRIFVQPVEEEE